MKKNKSTLYSDSSQHEYMDKYIQDSHNKFVVKNLLEIVGINGGETLLEIGAGYGRYTNELLLNELNVLALEPDKHMFSVLNENFSADNKIKCINKFCQW